MSYDKVSLLLPMNGANNGTMFTDYSPVQKTVAAVGDAKTSTAQFKYYDSSAAFDGSGDRITIPASSDFGFGTGDFTVEFWIRFNVVANSDLFDFRPSGGANPWVVNYISGGVGTFFSSGEDVRSAPLSTDVWYHCAIIRDAGVVRLFLDGTESSSVTNTIDLQSSRPLSIGSAWDGASAFNGYLQDIRIVKGAALYTANFTPPARLTGFISNAAVGAGKILDAAGNPAERTVIAVPRSAPVRVFSDVSNASGEFEIQAPAGVEHSVVALADEADLRNDLVARVIPV